MTFTVILTECERAPLVPVTVKVKLVPGDIVELMKTVMVEVAELPTVVTITGLSANVTVTPEGTIPWVSVTLPVKPLKLVTVRISEPMPPDPTERDVVVAVRLKLVTANGSHALVTAKLLPSPL